MKLKIGFTVSAETLFGLMAKILPIEDFHVEEILERQPLPTPKGAPSKQLAKPDAKPTMPRPPRPP